MTERETLALYEKTGALMHGHFRLTSGLHSDVYLQSALVLQHPESAAALGQALAAAFGGVGATTEIYTLSLHDALPILVAHEVARALGARCLFTERENGVMTLRRGFSVAPGERCLVVEDVITTGGSTREVFECMKRHGALVVGVGSLIDRSAGAARFPVTQVALARVGATTWTPEACPLCKSGSPAVKPGSRA